MRSLLCYDDMDVMLVNVMQGAQHRRAHGVARLHRFFDGVDQQMRTVPKGEIHDVVEHLSELRLRLNQMAREFVECLTRRFVIHTHKAHLRIRQRCMILIAHDIIVRHTVVVCVVKDVPLLALLIKERCVPATDVHRWGGYHIAVGVCVLARVPNQGVAVVVRSSFHAVLGIRHRPVRYECEHRALRTRAHPQAVRFPECLHGAPFPATVRCGLESAVQLSLEPYSFLLPRLLKIKLEHMAVAVVPLPFRRLCAVGVPSTVGVFVVRVRIVPRNRGIEGFLTAGSSRLLDNRCRRGRSLVLDSPPRF